MKVIIFCLIILFSICYLLYTHELGSGSGTSYPTGIDTDYEIETSTKIARSNVPNDANKAIVAIETELGVNPSGTYSNIINRFNSMYISSHSTGINITTNTYITGWSSATYFYGDGQYLLRIDADKLDGQHGSFYLSTTTAGTDYTSLTVFFGSMTIIDLRFNSISISTTNLQNNHISSMTAIDNTFNSISISTHNLEARFISSMTVIDSNFNSVSISTHNLEINHISSMTIIDNRFSEISGSTSTCLTKSSATATYTNYLQFVASTTETTNRLNEKLDKSSATATYTNYNQFVTTSTEITSIVNNIGVSTGTIYEQLNSTAGALTLETANRILDTYEIRASTSAFVKKLGDTITYLTATSSIEVTGSNFSVAGDTFVIVNGTIGVGTKSPESKIHIASSTGTGFRIDSSENVNALEIRHSAGNGMRHQFYLSGDGVYSIKDDLGVEKVRIRGGSAGGESASFFNGGNVGIGTGTPTNLLHVSSAIPTSAISKIINFSATGKGMIVTGGVDNANYNTQFRDYTDLAILMQISGNGNVGIGTITPSSKLDVNGNMIVRGSSLTTTCDAYISSNVYVTKDIVVSSRPMASLHWLLYCSSITVVQTAEVYTLVCGTSVLDDLSAWFRMIPDTNGNLNRLQYIGTNTHKFEIILNAGIEDKGVSASTGRIKIYKGGVATAYRTSQYFPIQDKNEILPLGQPISLATNDYIDVYFTTDDGDDLAVCEMHLNVIPID